MAAWGRMSFDDLDGSWAQSVAPVVSQQVGAGQLALAAGSDRFTASAASAENFGAARSAIEPQAFAGVDGAGRSIVDTLYGAVATTKTAIGAGLGREQAMLAGASYLAAMVKTLVADLGRSADNASAAGRGFTHYIRVVGGQGCSRCAILAGISSGAQAFRRHVNCECTAMPVAYVARIPKGLHANPQAYFDSLSDAEQDRIFTKAGAQAIRDGADPTRVVNARRGANGIGYSGHQAGLHQPGTPRGRFVKTTIGYRPNGDPVQVYTTAEATTIRGSFGRAQKATSGSRVRLMPESIIEIAGDDLRLRQAFLRDAGYIQYLPRVPYSNNAAVVADIRAQRQADRILVDRATAKYANFYLG